MRILFINSDPDRSELDMVLKINAKGIFIKILTSENSKYRKELEEAGVYIPCKDYNSKWNWALIRQIRSLINKEGFNILHAIHSSGLANAIWASYGKRLKIIGYRGTLAKIRRHDPTYWLGVLNPRVDKVVCVNKTIYDYMCNFYRPEKLLINYKGYDIKWAEELTKENTTIDGVPEDAFVVMYIAQTKNRPFKGLDILTEAIHHLNDPRIHFVFIGNYSKASKAIADNGAASNSIHFLGPLPNAAKYLVHADLFVLPSLRDGLPRVLKEAMAQEVPLIISDIPGPIELVDHKKTGLIVEPGNHIALAEAISYYNSHEKERIAHGKQGKEYLVSNFSSELFVEKIIGLYKQLYDEMVTN